MTVNSEFRKQLDEVIRNKYYDESLYSAKVYSISKNSRVRFSLPDASLKELDDSINKREKTFVETLFAFIDESDMTDVEVYKKARIGRKLFSKIRSDINYTPSKKTIICLILSLELDIDNARQLLKKAGYAFSSTSKFDIIVRFCIENQEYDIDEINGILFDYDQSLLGL